MSSYAAVPDRLAVLRRAWPRSLLPTSGRRLALACSLLFFNVLPYAKAHTLIPLPSTVGKLLTQGALVGAFILALTLNRKVVIRPNLYLGLFSLLALTSLMMSVRFVSLGTDYRAARLILFVAVLWLLTPWWGRQDLLVLRIYLTFLLVVVGSVVIGAIVAHNSAFQYANGRLGGAIWPSPPTQVAHYAADAAGLTLVLWLSGLVNRRRMLWIVLPCVLVIILSHTRTALVGLLAGVLVAGLSLFTSRRRVRRTFAALVLAAVVGWGFSPLITTWLARGENSQQLSQLTGRTVVWTELLASPRPEPNVIFGSGISNNSFDGLPIDSGWLSSYQDQGIVGDALDGAMFLVLLLTAALRPRGPSRALALFLVVYCLVGCFTESGLGEASSYMVDLAVAASLLAIPLRRSGLATRAAALDTVAT